LFVAPPKNDPFFFLSVFPLPGAFRWRFLLLNSLTNRENSYGAFLFFSTSRRTQPRNRLPYLSRPVDDPPPIYTLPPLTGLRGELFPVSFFWLPQRSFQNSVFSPRSRRRFSGSLSEGGTSLPPSLLCGQSVPPPRSPAE